jgi:hypothetical protein
MSADTPMTETNASISVNVHVRDETVINVEEHPDERRVVVDIGDNYPAFANLFLGVADLDRLIDVLCASRDRMVALR